MGYEDFTTGIANDLRFCAPEVIAGQAYTYTADTWAFGVVVFYVLTGRFPFDYKNCEPNQLNHKCAVACSKPRVKVTP